MLQNTYTIYLGKSGNERAKFIYVLKTLTKASDLEIRARVETWSEPVICDDFLAITLELTNDEYKKLSRYYIIRKSKVNRCCKNVSNRITVKNSIKYGYLGETVEIQYKCIRCGEISTWRCIDDNKWVKINKPA